MWSLRLRDDGTFYLTYDRSRNYTKRLGVWEYIGREGTAETNRLIAVNEYNGYICVPDDEGGVRALILTEENQYA